MPAKYLFRLDDITPDMNWEKFDRCLAIFKAHNIKPLLGIVPDNKDNKLSITSPSAHFWQRMRSLAISGEADIAQHGYQHLRRTQLYGILKKKYGFKPGSEFAGLSYDEQLDLIQSGKNILERNGLGTTVFMAPNHSFDKNTIKALITAGFTAVTDGIGLYPYKSKGILFIPQIFWKLHRAPIGIITICLHSNSIEEADFLALDNFVDSVYSISFSQAAQYRVGILGCLANQLFRLLYMILRAIKKKQ
jgi:predicted deacetylase